MRGVATAPELERALDEYVGLLRQGIEVSAVILYGSYAHGTPDEGSDIDVAVVSPDFDGVPSPDRQEVISSLTWKGGDTRVTGVGFAASEYASPASTSFLSEVIRTGRVIYAAPGVGPPRLADPADRDERRAAARHWFRLAEEELRAAELAVGIDYLEGAVGHIYASVDRALRALWILERGTYPPRAHTLDEAADRLERGAEAWRPLFRSLTERKPDEFDPFRIQYARAEVTHWIEQTHSLLRSLRGGKD